MNSAVEMWFAGSRGGVHLQGLAPLKEDTAGERAEEAQEVQVEVHRSWDHSPSRDLPTYHTGPGPPDEEDPDHPDEDDDSGHPMPEDEDMFLPVGFPVPDDGDSGHPLSELDTSLPDPDETGFIPHKRRTGLAIGASFDSSWSVYDSSDDEEGALAARRRGGS